MGLQVDTTAKSNGDGIGIELNVASVRRVLTFVFAALLLGHVVAAILMTLTTQEEFGALHELARRFYFDFENNVPAWTSTLGLFLAAGMMGMAAHLSQLKNQSGKWGWACLSMIFLCLALDEATYFHEILIESLRNRLNLSGIFYFAWVIPGAIFVATVALLYIPFLWRLPNMTRVGLLLAGGCYVGGALGMELLGGFFAESVGMEHFAYFAVMTIEESLEIVGIFVLLLVLLRHLSHLAPESVSVKIR